MIFLYRVILLALGMLVLLAEAPAATLPAGFVEEEVGSGWNEAVGLAFGKNADGTSDRTYVWERAGLVWIVGMLVGRNV